MAALMVRDQDAFTIYKYRREWTFVAPACIYGLKEKDIFMGLCQEEGRVWLLKVVPVPKV